MKNKKTKQKSPKLASAWETRLRLRAKGSKLYAKGDELQVEGEKLQAKGNKLRAKGNRLWAETILEVYGNIKVEWKNYDYEKQDYECHLETGEVFRP